MISALPLKEFKAFARTSEYDQDMLVSYQEELLSERVAIKRRKNNKQKRRRTAVTDKAPWQVKGQRQPALSHIRALDHQLLLTIGVGLVAFAWC